MLYFNNLYSGPIIARYTPTLIGECYKAVEWAEQMVKLWLSSGMCQDEKEETRDDRVKAIVDSLGSHALTKSHARHLSAQACIDIGLKVQWIESEGKEIGLQDSILSVHHANLLTLTNTTAFKIIENNQGKSFIQTASLEVLPR
jgi:hypothetical protein